MTLKDRGPLCEPLIDKAGFWLITALQRVSIKIKYKIPYPYALKPYTYVKRSKVRAAKYIAKSITGGCKVVDKADATG